MEQPKDKRRAEIRERRAQRWIQARGVPRWLFDMGLWLEEQAQPSTETARPATFGAATALLTLLFVLGAFGGVCEAKVDLAAIQKIESNGNPRAYNKGSGARGLYQITPICLDHYNEVHGTKIMTAMLFDPIVNEKIAEWYFGWLAGQGLDDVEQIVAFNWGIGNLMKWRLGVKELPKETEDYITKYQCLTAGDCK